MDENGWEKWICSQWVANGWKHDDRCDPRVQEAQAKQHAAESAHNAENWHGNHQGEHVYRSKDQVSPQYDDEALNVNDDANKETDSLM